MFATSCLVLLAGLAAPLPAAVPPVLLDAPVNATWCANHAEAWAARGFGGFLFPGIVDLLTVADEDRDSHLIHRNDPLLREIGLAQRRLANAGIGHNFLAIDIAPNLTWFSGKRLARIAEQRFRRAGAFARDAELRGVSVHLDGAAPLFDLRWEAYTLDTHGVRAAREAARSFGRRSLRALFREFQGAEILIVVDNLAEAGPLCHELLYGMIESIGLARSIRLHLALPFDATLDHAAFADALRSVKDDVERRIGAAGLQDTWQDAGSLVPSLAPFAAEAALVSAADFRESMLAAKLHAAHYVLCRGTGGGWYGIDPEEAAEYGVLHQQGAGAVRAASAVADAASYGVATPIDTMERVGPAATVSDAYVLRSGDRAAAILWEGHEAGLQIENRTGLVHAVFLEDGSDAYFTPRDGVVELPPLPGPVVLSGLPLAAWAVPAGMYFDTSGPGAATERGLPVRFGLHNPTTTRLGGTLTIDLDPGMSIGADRFPLRLDPGEHMEMRRTLRGVKLTGRPVQAQLNLITDAGAIFTRRLITPQVSRWVTTDWRDGAIVGMPAVADLDGDGDDEVLVATARGELTAYSVQGTERWTRRYRTSFVTGPAVGVLGRSGVRIAVVDDTRRVWILDRSGVPFSRTPIEGDAAGPPAFLPEGDGMLTGIFAVPLQDGGIAAVTTTGAGAWQVPMFRASENDAPQLVRAVDADVHLLYAYHKDTVVRLHADGRSDWQQTLDAPCGAPPVYVPTATGAHLVAPLRTGAIQVLEAWGGASEYLLDPGDGQAARTLAVVPGGDETAPELLAVYDDAIRRITLAGDVQAESATGTTLGGEAALLLHPAVTVIQETTGEPSGTGAAEALAASLTALNLDRPTIYLGSASVAIRSRR